MFKDFAKRLTSRKFLVTIGGITAVTLYPEQANNITAIIGLYLGAEGAADTVKRYQDGNVQAAKQLGIANGTIDAPDEGVDKTSIVPGATPTV
jgi:hypothetical protein